MTTPPRDVAALARQMNRALTATDEQTSELGDRLTALEEILAARWPRSVILRARLRRELRASVRDVVHGRTFAERRTETLASGWLRRGR